MGDDDAICDASPDGRHELVLTTVVIGRAGRGAATIDKCRWCGVPAYEASRTDRDG